MSDMTKAKAEQAMELYDRLMERLKNRLVSEHEIRMFVMMFLAAMEEMEKMRASSKSQ
jgi:hypothetical protein